MLKIEERTFPQMVERMSSIAKLQNKVSLLNMTDLAKNLQDQAVVMRQLSDEMIKRSEIIIKSTDQLSEILKSYVSNGKVNKFLEEH